jgi:hypothetical protein
MPTVEKKIAITLNGEQRCLLFDLIAFEAIGLNPFKAGTADSMAAFMEDFSPRKAALWIRAGLLHEYEEGSPRAGQEIPSPDQVFRWINQAFRDGTLTDTIMESLKLEAAGQAEAPAPANPPAA